MGYTALQPLTEGSSLDLEFLNNLAANDEYLKSIIPDVNVRTYITGLSANSEEGAQMKIMGASVPLGTITGPININLPMTYSHTAPWPPIITATCVSSVDIGIVVISWTPKTFMVRLTPSVTGPIKGARINWVGIAQVAS